MNGYSFRVVLHVLPSGEKHLDLFIRLPEADLLPTYEISAEHLEEFRELFGKKIAVRSEQDSAGIPAVRKADHRLLYWTYEGNISRNRGRIIEIAQGVCQGTILGNEIYLETLDGG